MMIDIADKAAERIAAIDWGSVFQMDVVPEETIEKLAGIIRKIFARNGHDGDCYW